MVARMAVAGMVVAGRVVAGATAVARPVSGAAVPAMAMAMAVAAEGEAGTEGTAGTVAAERKAEERADGLAVLVEAARERVAEATATKEVEERGARVMVKVATTAVEREAAEEAGGLVSAATDEVAAATARNCVSRDFLFDRESIDEPKVRNCKHARSPL